MKLFVDKTPPDEFITKVVGVSFNPDYPSNIWSLSTDPLLMNTPCSLVREPQNEHDTNSIRVDIGQKSIGHIPRLIALVIAPRIDEGETWLAQIDGIIVSMENTNQPGVKLKIWRATNANE